MKVESKRMKFKLVICSEQIRFIGGKKTWTWIMILKKQLKIRVRKYLSRGSLHRHHVVGDRAGTKSDNNNNNTSKG
jgi:hypothetical protein